MTPSTKVTAGVLAGAVATIIQWIVESTTDVDIPVLVVGAIVTGLTFLFSYLIPETNPAPSAVAEIEKRKREIMAPPRDVAPGDAYPPA